MLRSKDKLEEDFEKLNLKIEQAAEKELNRLHAEISALKDKANKKSEDLSSPASNEEKRS